MKSLITLLVVVAAALFAWSHWPGPNYAQMAEARDRYAQRADGDIVVAAINDPQRSDYVKGIALAVDELNKREGQLLGRRVKLRVEQGSTDAEAENALVHELAEDERVVAVLGHRSSAVAVPASLVYESSRVVFMPPFATRKSLTRHGFQYVFRMAPSGQVMADQLASLVALLGYNRVAVVNARDDYSREMAFLFEDSAVARGVRITHRASFLAEDEDQRSLIAELRAKSFDAVFVSASTEPGARVIQQLRELGVHAPVIGNDTLNSRDFAKAAGSSGNQTIVPVLYRDSRPGWRNEAFVARFVAAHQAQPDHAAAQGYDAMMLLARAIELARSTRTSAIASALHFMPFWVGVTGLHAFDPQGELRAKHYEFQELVDGQWMALPALQLSYQLERAEAEERLTGRPLPAGFSKAFRGDATIDDLATLQFELARRILPFERLGVLLATRDPDLITEHRNQLAQIAKAAGIALEICEIRDEMLDDDLALCLKTMPERGQVQAMMLAQFDDLRFVDTEAIAAQLRKVPLPSFAVSAVGNRVMPPGLAIYIDEAGHLKDFGPAVKTLERMLLRSKVEGVVSSLVNLPTVKVDLDRLHTLGVQSNPTLLNLYFSEMPPVAATFALSKEARKASTTPAPDAEPAPAPAAAPTADAPSDQPPAAAPPANPPPSTPGTAPATTTP